MEDDQVDLPGDDVEGDGLARSGPSGTGDGGPDEPEAQVPFTPVPVDQRALNIIGLSQARERLKAARARQAQDERDDPPAADPDELQASVNRHPAAQARRKLEQSRRGGEPRFRRASGSPKRAPGCDNRGDGDARSDQ